MAYQILISEEQRGALMIVLENHYGHIGPVPRELEYWPEMLRDLPKEEAESPGALHGFCL